jgi:hypothetical protein
MLTFAGSNGGAHNGAAGSSTDTPEEAAARSVVSSIDILKARIVLTLSPAVVL